MEISITLFTLLLSDRRYRSIPARTTRLKKKKFTFLILNIQYFWIQHDTFYFCIIILYIV